MVYLLLLVCLLHSFGFANSFYHHKTFFGRRVLSMKLRKNQDRDLFDKFEKYSFENDNDKRNKVLFDIYRLLDLNKKNETNSGDHNEQNTQTQYQDVTVLPYNFKKMIEDVDNDHINDSLRGNIPTAPQSEEEIEEDSFEGYLRSEFYKIIDKNGKINGKNIIHFESFYEWKKEKGIVFEKYEIREMFADVIGTKYICDIMEFIRLNHYIDERNAAEF